ncbi:BQ5605_C003g01833 [Microbotryum silenes-dioicae]|uniref:BQ5605_C003g01833 protein n=1 Tax=Microbotryum silenes-dioicae TaxID=796604 RepID=A0A2X0M3Y9_9BASI|nr:BQ5605_C003g01833 [Microbotryum silenes-dioicae]
MRIDVDAGLVPARARRMDRRPTPSPTGANDTARTDARVGVGVVVGGIIDPQGIVMRQSPRGRRGGVGRRRRETERTRSKDRKKKGLATIEWGKHGILTETDIYQKDQEFRAWLVGERMLNPETMSKAKEKDIFKEFMEDFNTGTLPHEKYYNMDKYEARASRRYLLESETGNHRGRLLALSMFADECHPRRRDGRDKRQI